VSSEARAKLVFEDILGLERTKDFQAPAELIFALFGVDEPVRILVYGTGCADVEVFVSASAAGRAPGFSHLCLECADRDGVVSRAAAAGFGVRRFARPDGSFIIFIQDPDANLYEIKQA
jgi:catechol 2,3-dioxygenase-like lactoylglutathione lyase family enzyme